MIDNLNIICANSILEEMEYGLFDETGMAIDVVSGKFEDDYEYEYEEDEVIHGKGIS